MRIALVLVGLMSAAVVVLGSGAVSATGGGGISPPSQPGNEPSVPDAPLDEEQLMLGVLPESVLRDYRSLYPGLSDDQIRSRYGQVNSTVVLGEQFGRDADYGGSWYDFEAATWHVYATDDESLQSMAASARAQGIVVAAERVARSYRFLEAVRQRFEAHVSDLNQYELRVSPVDNAVILELPAPPSERVKDALSREPAVTWRLGDVPETFPAACDSRTACGVPLRGGINVGRMSSGQALIGCSLGYTAHAGDGSRWFYTAGHCLTDAEVTNRTVYGHGEQAIGYARLRRDSGAVDAGWVRNNSAYWLSGSFGYIYKLPSEAVDVDYAIAYASTVSMNQVVCFSGRRLAPTDDNCGVITAENPSGKPQVTGLKVCGGDSGGSTYWINSGANERWAFGLVSVTSARTEPGDCTPNNGQMSFSSVPHINTWIDNNTASNVRIDVR
ncbi:MAG: hypothetical protein ACRDWY_04465 [Actinomycetes bacterium]